MRRPYILETHVELYDSGDLAMVSYQYETRGRPFLIIQPVPANVETLDVVPPIRALGVQYVPSIIPFTSTTTTSIVATTVEDSEAGPPKKADASGEKGDGNLVVVLAIVVVVVVLAILIMGVSWKRRARRAGKLRSELLSMSAPLSAACLQQVRARWADGCKGGRRKWECSGAFAA